MTENRPSLSTPTGGAMPRPEQPAQWCGYPYVWAWHVSLGSLSHRYIGDRCREAQESGAPPQAVYRTRADDPVAPNKWITVDQLDSDDRGRVKDYGDALLKWERDLAAHRQGTAPKPASPAQPLPQEQPAPAVPASVAVRGLRMAKRQPHQH
jgi:hypothetical protein